MNTKELFQDVVGKFSTENQAQTAYNVLTNAGMKTEHLSLEKAKLDLKDSVEESQVVKGAKGGAISGAALGGVIGLLVAIIINKLPDTPDINPFLAAIVSGIVWTAALALIGSLSGASAPKTLPGTEVNPQMYEYQLKVWGTPADIPVRGASAGRGSGSSSRHTRPRRADKSIPRPDAPGIWVLPERSGWLPVRMCFVPAVAWRMKYRW